MPREGPPSSSRGTASIQRNGSGKGVLTKAFQVGAGDLVLHFGAMIMWA